MRFAIICSLLSLASSQQLARDGRQEKIDDNQLLTPHLQEELKRQEEIYNKLIEAGLVDPLAHSYTTTSETSFRTDGQNEESTSSSGSSCSDEDNHEDSQNSIDNSVNPINPTVDFGGSHEGDLSKDVETTNPEQGADDDELSSTNRASEPNEEFTSNSENGEEAPLYGSETTPIVETLESASDNNPSEAAISDGSEPEHTESTTMTNEYVSDEPASEAAVEGAPVEGGASSDCNHAPSEDSRVPVETTTEDLPEDVGHELVDDALETESNSERPPSRKLRA